MGGSKVEESSVPLMWTTHRSHIFDGSKDRVEEVGLKVDGSMGRMVKAGLVNPKDMELDLVVSKKVYPGLLGPTHCKRRSIWLITGLGL